MTNADDQIIQAAKHLNCTSVTLVNIEGEYKQGRDYNWLYVYDLDKLSTRISFTETLSKNNVPKGKTGIQVEVYYSLHYESLAELASQGTDMAHNYLNI